MNKTREIRRLINEALDLIEDAIKEDPYKYHVDYYVAIKNQLESADSHASHCIND